MALKISYTFDDVLVQPNYSNFLPNEVNLEQTIKGKIKLKAPFISAAMDTITEFEMAKAMIEYGAMGIIHKNQSNDKIIEQISKLKNHFKNKNVPIGISVGTSTSEKDIDMFVKNGANIIVIDSAHGHSKNVGLKVSYVATKHPEVFLIAGNITTSKGARYLFNRGADAVKVGVGPGSICTTRIVTGVGEGQISALLNISAAAKEFDNKFIIADGGMKYSGDVFKALVAGANMVMMGSMLSGTKETPGELIETNGKKIKVYRGMGSIEAMKKGSKDRYNQSDVESVKVIPEGIAGFVPYKGEVKDVLIQIEGGVRNGMGYIGAGKISEIKSKGRFNVVTQAGVNASHPHTIESIIPASNYKGK